MNLVESQAMQNQRRALMEQLTAAETVLRACLHARGFDQIARAHIERARAHILEAHVALNEGNTARTVQLLVDDLQRCNSQRI